MKLSALLLPLLALALVQEALSTPLGSCEYNETREIVDIAVKEVVTAMKEEVVTAIKEEVVTAMKEVIQQQCNSPTTPPPQPINSEDNPGKSCKELHETYPAAPSGYFWIGNIGSAVRVYCSMDITCGSETGGWMRIADIDMRNASHTCPSGYTTLSSPKRLCDVSSGCISNFISIQDVEYSRVCGKIIGYQSGYSIAFYYGSRGIDGSYVFGVSLTHGQNPRQHIWTFAGASDETSSNPSFKCPCINTASTLSNGPGFLGNDSASTLSNVPGFLGNDYFCDTALPLGYYTYPDAVHTDDPLWDGQGCGPTNTCCSFNSPPWFVKDLPSPTTDNVEMRACKPVASGSTPFEIVELYIQ